MTRQKVGREAAESSPQQVPPSMCVCPFPDSDRSYTLQNPPGLFHTGPNYQWLHSWVSFLPQTTIHTPKLWKENEIWSHQLNSLKSNSKAKSIGNFLAYLSEKIKNKRRRQTGFQFQKNKTISMSTPVTEMIK